MHNKVLWTLDNELDPRTFERLSVDLLYRNGYKDIVPVGGMYDRGRDAEIRLATGTSARGGAVIFQFSLQKNWRAKLHAEWRKVQKEELHPTLYVFVTSQTVSGKDQDALRVTAREKYGWDLLILPREWLRLQLEEAHPDLAERHLGLTSSDRQVSFASSFRFSEPSSGNAEQAWEYFSKGDFERAAAELKVYVREHPQVSDAWEALAWSQYQLSRFIEALSSINKACELEPNNVQALSIRACILAEHGIQTANRDSVHEANRIFSEFVSTDPNSWVNHYNYANTLIAIKDTRRAIEHYLWASRLQPSEPSIWKNLASAYHEVGEHDQEMECFDRALEIAPEHAIALISKGISLIVDFSKAEEAVDLFEKALSKDPDLTLQWPHLWYWWAEAYGRSGRYRFALNVLSRGLRYVPGYRALKELRFKTYADAWRADNAFLSDAKAYFLEELAAEPLAFDSREELSRILESSGQIEEAWKMLQEAYSALDIITAQDIRPPGWNLEEFRVALRHLPSYLSFRSKNEISDYWNPDYPFNPPDLPPGEGEVADALFLYFSISFGLAYHSLSERADEDVPFTQDDANKLAMLVFGGVKTAIDHVVPFFAPWIPPKEELDSLSKRVADLVLFVPVIAVREYARQIGWIAGILGLPENLQEGTNEAFSPAQLESDTIGITIFGINRVAHIFPDRRRKNIVSFKKRGTLSPRKIPRVK